MTGEQLPFVGECLKQSRSGAPFGAANPAGIARLAQQPDAIAASADTADRSRGIRSTAYSAYWAGRVRPAAHAADRAGWIGSTAYAADWSRRVTGANAANRSGWIGSSSTWHNGFSL